MPQARIHSYGRDDCRGWRDEYLACDVAVLGPRDARRAAIVISGTHGAEGYCGSAIQRQWLASRPAGAAVEGLKVVLVHAINPWAFSHCSRATENNVDLNRNFLAASQAYVRENAAYDALAPFLHARINEADDMLAAYRAYRAYLDEHGWQLENAMLEGQSGHPDGLFYIGTRPEWSNRTFRRIVAEHLAGAEIVGFIDWHTGVGSWGEIVYLAFQNEDSPARDGWWTGRNPGGGAFTTGTVPHYEGLLCKAIRQELPDAVVAGAVVEFGTGDDYSIFRSDSMDRWLRFEGCTDPGRDRMKIEYRNACCPPPRHRLEAPRSQARHPDHGRIVRRAAGLVKARQTR